MVRIELDLNTDLEINKNNELTVKVAPDSSLEIHDDGLYVKYHEVSDQYKSYSGSYISENGLLVGKVSPYDENVMEGRVSAPVTVHRIFDAVDKNGGGIDIRSGIGDYVLPGDFYRVKENENEYSYYLVTSVSSSDNGGNHVTSHVLLGKV